MDTWGDYGICSATAWGFYACTAVDGGHAELTAVTSAYIPFSRSVACASAFAFASNCLVSGCLISADARVSLTGPRTSGEFSEEREGEVVNVWPDARYFDRRRRYFSNGDVEVLYSSSHYSSGVWVAGSSWYDS